MSKNSEKVIRWRKRTKSKMVEAMGGSCVCCGYRICLEALEFHHLDPTKKDFGFGAALASPKNISSIIDELRKCVLVCSNCHREIHSGLKIVPCSVPTLNESCLVSEVQLKRRIKRQLLLSNATHRKIPVDRKKIVLTDLELVELITAYGGNKSATARYLKVSETAVRKRLKSMSRSERK